MARPTVCVMRAQDDEQTRQAWIDARAGVAGDMLLAALLDAGADLDVVRRDVAAVLGAAVTLQPESVLRGPMRATALQVVLARPDQPHRAWREVRRLLEAAALPDRVRADAVRVFAALAEAEARVHGVDVDDVHFHEVGAWDSIADIVGVCSALADLHVDTVHASAIAVGDGYVRTAHGPMPVPVPAVLELLTQGEQVARALPVDPAVAASLRSEPVGELATPTGVAVLVALASGGAVDLPPGSVGDVGVGAGSRDDLPWPNIVRVVLSPPAAPVDVGAGLRERRLDELAANVDDLDPRAWPSVLDALLAAGARDAWLTPIHMKKGRPAFTVSALVEPEDAAAARRVLFETTSTFGVRSREVRRVELDRRIVPVEVHRGGAVADDVDAGDAGDAGDAVGVVGVKVGSAGGQIVRATPEYEDCARLAREWGTPVAEVLARAAAAAHAAGLTPGTAVPRE